MKIQITKTRNDMLATLPKNARCAELGVFCGDFSHSILLICRPSRLYLVDIFETPIESGNWNGTANLLIDMRNEMPNLKKRFGNMPEVEIVKAKSFEWMKSLPVGDLDWVYIDTDHQLDTTRLELRAAFHAVKVGGWICGHNFNFPGVCQAVSEFADEKRLDLEVWDAETYSSWKLQIK